MPDLIAFSEFENSWSSWSLKVMTWLFEFEVRHFFKFFDCV